MELSGCISTQGYQCEAHSYKLRCLLSPMASISVGVMQLRSMGLRVAHVTSLLRTVGIMLMSILEEGKENGRSGRESVEDFSTR